MRIAVGDATVSGVLDRPPSARALLVLAHGAGAGMHHPFMTALAGALVARGIAVLRYQFPFTEAGTRRPDRAPVLEATVRAAVAAGRALGLPTFAGGKSMGGRMTTQAAAGGDLDVLGIVLVGFPLHPPKKTRSGGPDRVGPGATKPAGTERARHLAQVPVPTLFLQGTRDALAPLAELRPVLRRLPHAELCVVDTADHGFALLARRKGDDVHAELADAIVAFVDARLEATRPAASRGRSASRPAPASTPAARSTRPRRRTQRRTECTTRRPEAAEEACRRSRTGR